MVRFHGLNTDFAQIFVVFPLRLKTCSLHLFILFFSILYTFYPFFWWFVVLLVDLVIIDPERPIGQRLVYECLLRRIDSILFTIQTTYRRINFFLTTMQREENSEHRRCGDIRRRKIPRTWLSSHMLRG